MTADVDASMTSRPMSVDGAVAELRTTAAIRERAQQLLRRARAGESAWFVVDDDALPAAANEVAEVTVLRYPDLDIPFHSRWRHVEAGGVDRLAAAADRLPSDPAERARTLIDFVVVSVLLDAGAGADWRFTEPGTGLRFGRSEGLGVASWHAFLDGRFSSDPDQPLQVDGSALRASTAADLGAAFGVSDTNPIVGLDGRAQLLRRLGEAMANDPATFGRVARPGHLYDAVLCGTAASGGGHTAVSAHAVLSALLSSLSGIWLTGNGIGGVPLGDCWPCPVVHGAGRTDGWMPFHKLSQWLTYSMLEPFSDSGVQITGLDELTGLPEYRNGGLLLDTGVLALRDPEVATRAWEVSAELVVEWRALTVALLDELAPLVRARLGVEEDRMPLACVLEGGTWAAGRSVAARLRDGSPPLPIVSDGTVF